MTNVWKPTENSLYLIAVLEYAADGEMFDLVTKSATRRFDEATARHYFKQLMHGVAFMHSRHITHRDMSLENMLVAANHVGKVSLSS